MASIVTRPNGTREIRFKGVDGKPKTLRVGKLPKKATKAIASKVEHLVAHRIAGSAADTSVMEWVAGLDAKFHSRLVALGVADPREADVVVKTVTLGEWLDRYFESLTVKPSTVSALEKPRANLIDFFGRDRALDSITAHDAKEFEADLIKNGNRRKKEGGGLAPNTVRRRIGQAKQFFIAAMDAELITANPFKKLKASVVGNPERQFFVTHQAATACIENAPDREWELIIALCRFGGMRCPSEVVGLRWVDVNLPERRMTVRASKTEHHADGGVRVCPIFPELFPYLDRAWESLEPGADSEFVINRYRSAGQNLRTTFEK